MPIINNLAGYGSGSGKVDEFGLPIFVPPGATLDRMDSEFHQTLSTGLNPLEYAFPQGAAGYFVISNGRESQTPLPSANYYDLTKAPITAGWKRGLYVIAPQLGVSAMSLMVRSPVAGWELKFSIANIDCSDVLADMTILTTDNECGLNFVKEFDTVILDGQYYMWVEVIAAPAVPACCPLVVSSRVVVKDYCHESIAGMSIPCTDCEPCGTATTPAGTHALS